MMPQEYPPTFGRSPIVIFAVVVALALVLSALSLRGLNSEILGLFHDDALYSVVAKSLGEGDGYRLISLPSAPSQTKYPFLYSYLLSWLWRIQPNFPENIVFLKTLNVVVYFWVIALACVLYRFNVAANSWTIIPFGFLVGANALIVSLTDFTLSDPLFLALILLSLILSQQLASSSFSPALLILLAITVGLAYLTRQAGLCLILAGMAQLLVKRLYRKALAFGVIVLAVVSVWLFWLMNAPQTTMPSPLVDYYVSYEKLLIVHDPVKALQVVRDNIFYMVTSIDRALLLPALSWLRVLVYPLIALGLLLTLRRQGVFGSTFLSLYMFMVLLYPFHPHRYVMPLVPLIWMFFFKGMRAVGSERNEPRSLRNVPKIVVDVLLICVLVLNAIWLNSYWRSSSEQRTRVWYGIMLPYQWRGFEETFAWIKAHTRKEDVLATGYDPMYYLYTGRQAVRPWFHKPETYFYPSGKAQADIGSAEQVRSELKALGVRYLVVDPLDGYAEKEAATRLFAELLRSYPIEPRLVFTSSDFLHKVYLLEPDS